MSNHTHKMAYDAIYKERSEALRHHVEYFERVIAKLREFKMRQALGEVCMHAGGGYTPTLDTLIAQETRQLVYAIKCVRTSRRALWQFMALRRKMPYRVEYDT